MESPLHDGALMLSPQLSLSMSVVSPLATSTLHSRPVLSVMAIIDESGLHVMLSLKQPSVDVRRRLAPDPSAGATNSS